MITYHYPHKKTYISGNTNVKKRHASKDMDAYLHPLKKSKITDCLVHRPYNSHMYRMPTGVGELILMLKQCPFSADHGNQDTYDCHHIGVDYHLITPDPCRFVNVNDPHRTINDARRVPDVRRESASPRGKGTVSKEFMSPFSMFDLLPSETILFIFSFIPTCPDALPVRLVSHSWEKMLRDTHLRKLIHVDDAMRQAEMYYTIPLDYMSSIQKDITPAMRLVLIDWLVEVADEFRFHPETLFYCVNHVDRYLAAEPVSKAKLQLVGVTAMILAAKYEETCYPRVDDFVILSDNTYTRDEIFSMEISMLATLKFSLSAVTSRTFLTRFLMCLPLDEPSRDILSNLSNYLIELAILDYNISLVNPSLVAASALSLSLHTLGYTPWTSTLEMFTQHSLSDHKMKQCVHHLLELFRGSSSSVTRFVYDKYSQERFSCVSALSIPATVPKGVAPFFCKRVDDA